MATPRKGPSFSGPVSGWTASSLTPKTTTTANTDPALKQVLATKGWNYAPDVGWKQGPAPAPGATGTAGSAMAPFTLFEQDGTTAWFDDTDGSLHQIDKSGIKYKNGAVNDLAGLNGTPFSPEQLAAQRAGRAAKYATPGKPKFGAAMGAGSGIDNSMAGGGGGGSGGSSGSDGGSSAAGGGRGAGFGNRGAFTTPTPLESLLASIFPDAAGGPAAPSPNPNTAAPQGSELFRTILGNLGSAGGGAAPAPVYAPPPVYGGAGAEIASSIPGAPPFLAGAINNVNNAGIYAPPPVAGGGFNPAGIAALAAEQRIQAAEAEKARREAEAAWFQQQQQNQRAQAMTAQRQRQRFGGVNALTSGWGSSPVLY